MSDLVVGRYNTEHAVRVRQRLAVGGERLVAEQKGMVTGPEPFTELQDAARPIDPT